MTAKIKSGYFTNLGVNVLWITVPVKNADSVVGAGVQCDGSGNCSATSHEYSAYHGYWPADPTTFEPCFGTQQDLTDLVTAAHAAKIKVLFDYAMVHVHTSSAVYTQNVSSGWFTPFCQCGGSCAQEQLQRPPAGSPRTSRTTTTRTPPRARSPSTRRCRS